MEKRLKDAEAELRRHHAAIEAGTDPAAFVEAINVTQAERHTARAELEHLPESVTIDAAEVCAMLDSLRDVAGALDSRLPERITQVHRDLGIQMIHDNEKEAVTVTASPRVANVCVRGGLAH